MGDRSYLSIGDVLALLREEFPDITISKIRFLESRGLLVPERTPSGYRKFYDHDVDRLRWILRQQREHFLPLKVIKGRLEGQVPSSEPAALFEVQEVEARHAGASAPPQSVSDGVLEPALAVNGSHAVLEAAAAQPSAAVMARPGHSASTVQAPAAGLIPPRPQVPTSTHTPVGSTPPGAGPAIPASAGPVAASAGASTSGPASSPPASSGTASPGALAGKAEAHSRPSAGASVPGISGAAAPTGAHEDAAPGPARASHRPHSAAPTHAEAARAAAVGGVPASPAPGPPPGAPGQAASSAHGSAPGASGDSGAGHAGHGPTAPPAGPGAPTTRASAGHAAAGSSAPSSVSRDRGDGPSDPAASMAGGRPPEAASLSGASLTAAELAQASGLDADQVAELESYGLIESRAVAGVSCYDENALVVAGLAASFARFGVEARHLKLFKHAAERQASLYSQVVMPLLRQRNPDARRRAHDDLTRLTELGSSMQACFAKAVLRNLTRG